MADTSPVTLPNGNILSDVPEGATRQQIIDAAIALELATPEVFDMPSAETEGQEGSAWYEKAGAFLKENMEIPMGLGGSGLGAVAGAPFGPVGIVGGAVIGGALGSGAGSLTSDALAGEDLDYYEALKESAWSAGTDLALLGVGKVVGPPLKNWIKNQRVLGFTPEESAQELLKAAKLGKESGTPESLRASQSILQEGRGNVTGTLSGYQTGQLTPLESFFQRLGELGIVSRPITEQNAVNVNNIIQGNLSDIIARSNIVDSSSTSIGQEMFAVVDAGRKALQTMYGNGLDEVQGLLGTQLVDVGGLSKALSKFSKDHGITTYSTSSYTRGARGVEATVPTIRASGSISDLSEVTQKALSDLNTLSRGGVRVSAEDLIALDKGINKTLQEVGSSSSSQYNSIAARELTELHKGVKESIYTILTDVSPEAATLYKQLGDTYSSSIGAMLPPINKTVLENANRENFDALGNLLMTQNNVSKINSFMKSIDEAYKHIDIDETVGLSFVTAADAKQAIRSGFLKNLIPDVAQDNFSIETYSNMARQFATPQQAARFKAVLGDDYLRVKQLMNAMEEATTTPNSNIGELVLRSKEYQAASNVAQAGMVGVAAGTGGSGIGLAAAVLTLPMVFAKISTNQKMVNRFLVFGRRRFATPDAMALAASNLMADVVAEMSEEELAEVRNSVRTLQTQ